MIFYEVITCDDFVKSAAIWALRGSVIVQSKEKKFMSIEDKVKKIIAEKLGVDLAEVVMDASFVDDLGADSLDLVELIMSMEEEFDIDISDENAEKIVRVKDAVNFITSHISD